MEMTTQQKLEIYINAELGDSELYRELSKMALNDLDKKILLELSSDEQNHADTFKNIYKMLTGKFYNPIIPTPILSGTFNDIIHDRVLDESGDFRKYAEQYAMTNKKILKDAYYLASTDENVHALRLLNMLS